MKLPPRKSCPVSVKCRIAMRQLGEMFPDQVLDEHKGKHGALLRSLLDKLADLLGCAVTELRRDHDPALGIREKIMVDGKIVGYVPDENDPAYQIYRTAHAHHIKTNVRGDGAQYSDTVLMKRERRRNAKPKRKAKIKSANRWPPKGSRKIDNRRK